MLFWLILAEMDWLQKHVVKLCDGKTPSSQGPYTVPYLLKAKERWAQHYVKGLDKELKPVVFEPKVNIYRKCI